MNNKFDNEIRWDPLDRDFKLHWKGWFSTSRRCISEMMPKACITNSYMLELSTDTKVDGLDEARTAEKRMQLLELQRSSRFSNVTLYINLLVQFIRPIAVSHFFKI